MRFGSGFEIGRNVIIGKAYNSTLDIKFLALLNAFGSAGEWQVFAGISLASTQLEVQWAYSGHLVHLQGGTVHALYCFTVGLQCALQHTVRPLHFELGI